jgi:PIN domain nuclease of toxin-antitoxin system
LATKVNLGKLDAREVISALPQLLLEEGFRRLAISTDHALRAGLLPLLHRDPFDRMLVAQAQALNSPVVSADAVFDRYGVQRIW